MENLGKHSEHACVNWPIEREREKGQKWLFKSFKTMLTLRYFQCAMKKGFHDARFKEQKVIIKNFIVVCLINFYN